MLGLDSVVDVAHLAEDLLGALRDGRMPVRKDLVDVLLVAADGISRAMPGADRPVGRRGPGGDRRRALDAACAGQSPVVVPKLRGGRRGDRRRRPASAQRRLHPGADPARARPAQRGRRGRAGDPPAGPPRPGPVDAGGDPAEVVARAARGRHQGRGRGLPAAAHRRGGGARLVALGDQLVAATRELASRGEDAQGRLGSVRDGAMGLAMVPVRRVVAGFPQLVRELAGTGPDAKDVRLDPDRRGRRAGHARAGHRRRLAAAPGHQRRRPRLRAARRAGRPRQAGAGDGHRLGPGRGLHRGHRGRRRRERRRRGRAAHGSHRPRPAPRGHDTRRARSAADRSSRPASRPGPRSPRPPAEAWASTSYAPSWAT